MRHRGRLQVQGNDVGVGFSHPWARDTAYPADEALEALTGLESACSESAREARALAFRKARRFIENARVGGGVGPTRQTFQDERPVPKDARVDIEVLAGLAFT